MPWINDIACNRCGSLRSRVKGSWWVAFRGNTPGMSLRPIEPKDENPGSPAIFLCGDACVTKEIQALLREPLRVEAKAA